MTFSSPSGDGLVPHELGLNDIESWFSSPSGDGLVLEKRKDVKNMKKNFSSPLGDGLVHKKNQKDGNSAAYFRGWVGSLDSIQNGSRK